MILDTPDNGIVFDLPTHQLPTGQQQQRQKRSVDALVQSLTPKNDDDDEMKLVNFLLTNYNKEVRPVQNKSDAVQVVFGIAYTQLLDLVLKLSFFSFLFYICNEDSTCHSNRACTRS